MFSLGIRASKLTQRPFIPRMRFNNVRQGFFEETEFRALQQHLPEEIRPITEFAYLTGWPKGEILTLEWRQVDFDAKTVRLEPGTTKNGEGRTFPFGSFPKLEALLKKQREITDAFQKSSNQIIPWVFHRQGKPILDYRRAWQKALESAHLPKRIPHDFRRTAVRNLERAGVPRSAAMKLTGHKTESIYQRYAIVSENDLGGGVAKLAALHGACSEAKGSQKLFPFPDQHEKVKSG